MVWASSGLAARLRLSRGPLAATLAVTLVLATTRVASAHHEALFGPQSSLAVESEGFVSLQNHAHAYGTNGTQSNESTYILSAGISPVRDVPWAVAVVQPFTYQTTAAPTPAGSSGPFSACDGCFRRENNLVSTSYRFDFRSLREAWGKDGNFALVSFALEPPTGNKDYETLKGPFNFITAGMAGLEWSSFSAVALGYYRRNSPDSTDSKKGDNFLLGLGFAYTPVDAEDSMISFQLGLGDEYHLADVDHGVSVGGGNEVLLSPTVVASPRRHFRVFALASFPLAQAYSADYQVDRWRVGVGVIYSFERAEPSAVLPSARVAR
jgi:hypothetical protein